VVLGFNGCTPYWNFTVGNQKELGRDSQENGLIAFIRMVWKINS
jgi:hypothetical protein